MNMSNVLGLIFANMHDSTIYEITKARTMGSIPFAARYRLIDFPLSNMVNSGISEVGVITKHNYQSLLDHLGSGREWDLSRKVGGLHILPPFGNASSGIYGGKLDALNGVLDFIRFSKAEYVVMSDCDVVANMDLRPILDAHIESGAEITAVYARDAFRMEQTRSATVFAVNEENKVYDVLITPELSGECSVSLNTYIVNKKFLEAVTVYGVSRNKVSFERDVLQGMLRDIYINAYRYDGYYCRIDCMKSYYDANLSLLEPDVRKKLFLPHNAIYTKVRDRAPTRYGLDAVAKNSLLADGCEIEGTVENSIIFRGVRVKRGATVRNSIVMQDTVIGSKCDVSCAILDKDVMVSDFRSLVGSSLYPVFVAKGAVV